jgi:glycerophosphoryl diester phosphodiesterase
MSKSFLIAHAANNTDALQSAFDSGADFAEIDVWKAPLRHDLTVKHDGMSGGLGFGQKLADFLTLEVLKEDSQKTEFYFDFKWGGKGGLEKLIKFLKSHELEKPVISSTDWYALLWANNKYGIVPHFTIANTINLQIFKHLYKTRLYHEFKVRGRHGISIRARFLKPEDAAEFKKNDVEIVVWTLNSQKEVEKYVKIGVWGIVVGNYNLIKNFKRIAIS